MLPTGSRLHEESLKASRVPCSTAPAPRAGAQWAQPLPPLKLRLDKHVGEMYKKPWGSRRPSDGLRRGYSSEAASRPYTSSSAASLETWRPMTSSSQGGRSQLLSPHSSESFLSDSTAMNWDKAQRRRRDQRAMKKCIRYDEIISLDEVTEQLSHTVEQLSRTVERKKVLISERHLEQAGSKGFRPHRSWPEPKMVMEQDAAGVGRASASGTAPVDSTDAIPQAFGDDFASDMDSLPTWLCRSAPALATAETRRPQARLGPLPSDQLASVGLNQSKLASFHKRASSTSSLHLQGKESRAMAHLAAKGYAESIVGTASKRVQAKEVADNLLSDALGGADHDLPPRLCIYFGSSDDVPSEELAQELAKVFVPFGERALILVSGETTAQVGFCNAVQTAAPDVPVWRVLPVGRHTQLAAGWELQAGSDDASCRDAFSQLGDFYVTLGSGPDAREVLNACAASGVGALPLCLDDAGGLCVLPSSKPSRPARRPRFIAVERWEQICRQRPSADEMSSFVAEALDGFLDEADARDEAPVPGFIEFDIGDVRYAAKIIGKSTLAEPGAGGGTHQLMYSRCESADAEVEWVVLDHRRRLLSDAYGHKDVPYRYVEGDASLVDSDNVSEVESSNGSVDSSLQQSLRGDKGGSSSRATSGRKRGPAASQPLSSLFLGTHSRMETEKRDESQRRSPMLRRAITRASVGPTTRRRMSVRDVQLRVQERTPSSGKDDDDDGVVNFDPQTSAVFTRFEIQGEISTEVLPEACCALGFWMINKDWIQEVVSSRFGGRSFIDRNEFFLFSKRYTKLFLTHMKERFDAADRRRAGRLGPAEISHFLRVQGITPVNSVVEELMSEASGPGKEKEHMDLEQFLELNKVVWKRAGFTRTETAAFQELLPRYPALASGNHGEAGIEELRACMRWLGFPASRKNVEVLFAEALDDKNWGSRPIVPDNERDFLLILRAQREQWIRRVMRAFSFQDQQTNVSGGSPDGCLQHDELQDFMEKLGFVAWPEALKEAVQDCRLANKPGLIFEDLYQILETFRKKEGFVHEELEDVKETYRRFDPRFTDNIFGVQLHNALRWAGWNCTLSEVLDTMVDFDLDENEAISQIEFVKLVKMYRERLIVNMMKMYKEKGLHLPGKVTEEILKKVAEVWDEHKARFENGASGWEWTRLVMQHWKLQRDRLRGSWGFSEEETLALKARFSRFDTDADGSVHLADRRSSASLMEDLFPDVRNDPEAHRRASEWIAELQHRQNGTLTFDEFLRKMRQVQDAAAEEKLKDEEHARQEAELSRQEVKEFRKIFSMFDADASGEMSLSELKEMLGTLTSISASAQSSLREALRAVDRDGNRELDFPEFLRLMKKLESENWNDINAAAAECNKVKETLQEAEREMHSTMMSKTNTIAWPENMEEHVIQLDPEEMTP